LRERQTCRASSKPAERRGVRRWTGIKILGRTAPFATAAGGTPVKPGFKAKVKGKNADNTIEEWSISYDPWTGSSINAPAGHQLTFVKISKNDGLASEAGEKVKVDWELLFGASAGGLNLGSGGSGAFGGSNFFGVFAFQSRFKVTIFKHWKFLFLSLSSKVGLPRQGAIAGITFDAFGPAVIF